MSEFETWWHNEGSAPKRNGEDLEEFVHRMCKVAWYNGAFCARRKMEETGDEGLGHKTRFSDSSVYDEVCIKCGATDARSDNRLLKPCPKTKESGDE